jgi:hypothetical protein
MFKPIRSIALRSQRVCQLDDTRRRGVVAGLAAFAIAAFSRTNSAAHSAYGTVQSAFRTPDPIAV